MNKWKHSTMSEFMKEVFPTSTDTRFQRFSQSLGYIFFHFAYWQPSLWLFIAALFHNFNWSLLFIAFLVLIIELRVRFADSNLINSYFTIKELDLFITNTLIPECSLIEYDLDKIIGDENINKFRPMRFAATAKQNNYPISRVFYIQSDSKMSAQDKGFALPLAYKKGEAYPYSLSMIFLNSNPEKYTLREIFTLYHELGHTTKFNVYIKNRIPNLILTITLLFLTTILFSKNLIIGLSLFSIYTFVRYFFANKRTSITDEELLADCLAILKMPDSYKRNNIDTKIDWDKLKQILITTFQTNSTGKNWFKDDKFKTIRSDYIAGLIDNRKKNNFDISFYIHVNKIIRNNPVKLTIILLVFCMGLNIHISSEHNMILISFFLGILVISIFANHRLRKMIEKHALSIETKISKLTTQP